MKKEEIRKQTQEFSDKYGEITLLRANVAAINKMLADRGKSEELYDILSRMMKKYDQESI